jgi:hypothetical protein
MSNFKIGYNHAGFTAVASSTDSGYYAYNLNVYDKPKRRWQTSTVTTQNIVLDTSSSPTINAIVIYDANFVSITLQGNASDSWTSPSWSQSYSLVYDGRTDKYKLWADLTSSPKSYRYYRIVMTTAVESTFKIGSVMLCKDVWEMSVNPSHPYSVEMDNKVKENEFETGEIEEIVLGDVKWKGTVAWDVIREAEEPDFLTLLQMPKGTAVCLFENNSDNGKCYICRRKDPVTIQYAESLTRKIPSITYTEV